MGVRARSRIRPDERNGSDGDVWPFEFLRSACRQRANDRFWRCSEVIGLMLACPRTAMTA